MTSYNSQSEEMLKKSRKVTEINRLRYLSIDVYEGININPSMTKQIFQYKLNKYKLNLSVPEVN